jgi:hypothetical protein
MLKLDRDRGLSDAEMLTDYEALVDALGWRDKDPEVRLRLASQAVNTPKRTADISLPMSKTDQTGAHSRIVLPFSLTPSSASLKEATWFELHAHEKVKMNVDDLKNFCRAVLGFYGDE